MLQSKQDPKQFRMVEAWTTQAHLDMHGGTFVFLCTDAGTKRAVCPPPPNAGKNGHPIRPHFEAKQTMAQLPAFKDCGAASVDVDLTYTEVDCT